MLNCVYFGVKRHFQLSSAELTGLKIALSQGCMSVQSECKILLGQDASL